MKRTLNSRSFLFALSLHIVLISALLFTFERTIRIPAELPQEQNKPIIDAVMINNQTVQKEVERLNKIEKQKQERERARQREIAKKQREAVEKRKQEEALALELKKQNEALKKEAEQQRLAKQKQEKEEKIEKERLAKEKKQQEDELKVIQKQKEEALAQQKKKIEDEKKAAEESARQQANIKVRMDQITRHAMLIKDRINRNWRQPPGFDLDGLKCELDVKLLPTGEVDRVVIRKTSGNSEFDKSAERAVYKASPLPMPNDQELAKEFRQFSFTFLRPEVA